MKNKISYSFFWIMLIALWIFLISDIVLGVYRPAPRFAGEINNEQGFAVMNGWQRVLASFSFWTTWSNWLLAIFFTVVLLKPKGKINFNWWTIMASYMTLTMILFWMGLAGVKAVGEGFQTKFINDYSDITRLIYSIILHLVTPGFIIGAWTYQCGKQKINQLEFNKFYILIAVGFLVFYLIFVLTRGMIRTNQGADIWTSYPYFFFAIGIEKGIFLLSISSIVIILVMVGILLGFTKINNFVAQKQGNNQEVNLGFQIKLLNYNLKSKIIYLLLSIIASLAMIGLGIWLLTGVENYLGNQTKEEHKYFFVSNIAWVFCLSLWVVSGVVVICLSAFAFKYSKVLKIQNQFLLILGVSSLLFYGVGLFAVGLFLWKYYSTDYLGVTK
ncbi:hypothetical protein SSABA_v1c00430 [Spiroplasma sabaudiense Ar-1343]|uniref:Uncharacterized protein n=1 Tax=Spiroplasma sabaudiense Ar-1343 TaxID=1276257 RepID=W6A987_9MOLU|nr:hypothetical protein [Spiroplasma sabaudiense]AHI53455.1 hypothetical protein SSABA_v1c00430 [Spiroplasma sabaudiense Ar-1343]